MLNPTANLSSLSTFSTSANVAAACAYHHQTCVTDEDCRQLEDIFMRAFHLEESTDGSLETTSAVDLGGAFSDVIHPLVRRITQKLGSGALHCIWVHSATVTAKDWSIVFLTREGLPQLSFLLRAWQAYQNAVNLIHSFTIYAQNELIRKYMAPAKTSPYFLINDMCRAIFVEHFLGSPDARKKVFNSMMGVIKSGDEKQVETIRALLQLLSYLDSSHQVVYYRTCALPYLTSLQDVYSKDQPTITSADDAISYLKKVEHIIEKEIAIARLYAFSEPFTRMIGRVLYSQLIETHRQQLCSFAIFEEMVRNGLHANQREPVWFKLAYLYQMLKYDEESIKLQTSNIGNYLTAALDSIAVLDCKEKPGTAEDAQMFVCQVYELHQGWFGKFDACFGPHQMGVRKAISGAFSAYLNSDPVYGCLLSLYSHLNCVDVTSSNLPADAEKCLLALVQDKQSITNYARYFLCNRILLELSPSAEKDVATTGQLLDSLEVEAPFSVKLLLKNFQTSIHQLSDNRLVKHYGQSFQIRLLSALWNLDTSTRTQLFRLPRSFWVLYNAFRSEYVAANPKKKLHLNRNYGFAKLTCTFQCGRMLYQFQTSLRQTVILLCFNGHDSRSFGDIQRRTKVDTESLLQAIKLFLKYGLLLVVFPINDNESDSLTESTFAINEKFMHSTVENRCLALSIKKGEQIVASPSKASGIIQINWIKLQHLYSAQFDLAQIMTKCSEDPFVNESVLNTPAVTSSKADTSSTKQEQVEANPIGSNTGTFRLEAAVVRVLKRATVVDNLDNLRDLTVEALGSTTWASQLQSPKKVLSCFSQAELQKCVDSLEKNGYLRQLPSGEIVYEP